MNRHQGDAEAPDPLDPSHRDLPDPLAFPESDPAAWLWHDLALPLHIEPLLADASTVLQESLQGLLHTGKLERAEELCRICLGLSEGAPDVRSRAFWQLCAGVFEALALQALSLDEALKQLLNQVQAQTQRYREQPRGSVVSELLCHELLDVCLQAPERPGAVLLPLIRQAYAWQHVPVVHLSLPGDEQQSRQALDDAKEVDEAEEPGDTEERLQVASELGHQPEPEPKLVPQVTVAEDDAPAQAVVAPGATVLPNELAPMLVSQAMSWSRELAQELATWSSKPSRPLPATAGVLAQVLAELLKTAALHDLGAVAAALHAALQRSTRLIAVLPVQAEVLVQAAQQLHQHMQTLAAGGVSKLSAEELAAELSRLDSWPPALQIQEQDHQVEQAVQAEKAQEFEPVEPVQDAQGVQEGQEVEEQPQNLEAQNTSNIEQEPTAQPTPQTSPESTSQTGSPVVKVMRPVLTSPDAPRMLYVQSILARCLKALQPQGLRAELSMHDPDVALVRADLQQLGHLLDLLLPALRLSQGREVSSPVLQVSVQPAHDHITLEFQWWQGAQDSAPLDDLEMGTHWQMLLSHTGATLQAVGNGWRLTLPVQHVLCTVQLLRAGDLKLATPSPSVQLGDGFIGRNPPVAVTEVTGKQEVLLQAPNPVMRRVHGVVGVIPKSASEAGLPVLVYRADLFQTGFFTTP